SIMRIAKLFVPSGTPVHDNCGETFSPTQLGFFGAFAVLLATFLGSMVPSLKVVEVSVNTSAALAACATIPSAGNSRPMIRRADFFIAEFLFSNRSLKLKKSLYRHPAVCLMHPRAANSLLHITAPRSSPYFLLSSASRSAK